MSGRPPPHALTGRTPVVLHFVGHAKWYHLKRCNEVFLRQHSVALETGLSPEVNACFPPVGEVAAALTGECWSIPSTALGYFDVDRDEHFLREIPDMNQLLGSSK